jgi:hypothetical protein
MRDVRPESKVLSADGFRAAFLVTLPIDGLIASQLVQIPPGEQAGVVPVVEHNFDGILSDGLDGADADSLFIEHQHLLSGPMSFDFRGGRMHTQVFERQLEPAAVRKTHFQQPGLAAYLDFGREGVGHMSPSIGPGL